MNIQLSFDELQDFIARHFNKNVKISAVDDTTIVVNTSVKVAFLTKDVSMNISVLDINGTDVILSYNNGLGVDFIVKSALYFAQNFKPQYGELVNSGASNTLTIHMGKVKQLEKVFEHLALQKLRFMNDRISLDAILK